MMDPDLEKEWGQEKENNWKKRRGEPRKPPSPFLGDGDEGAALSLLFLFLRPAYVAGFSRQS